MKSTRSLLLGGILPILIFTFVEEVYGVFWGSIAGIVFSLGEVLYEKFFIGQVQKITWVSFFFILILGGVSVLTQDGFWFKVQTAILQGILGVILIGSFLMKKPLIVTLANAQGLFEKVPEQKDFLEKSFGRLTFRLGFYFIFLGGVSAWIAFEASTRFFSFWKSLGLPIALMGYMLIEIFFMRAAQKRSISKLG